MEQTGEGHQEAIESAKKHMQERNKAVGKEALAIRLKTGVVEEIEEVVGGKLAEVVLAPELRSTNWSTQPKDITPRMCSSTTQQNSGKTDEGKQESETVTKTKQMAKSTQHTPDNHRQYQQEDAHPT